MNKRTVEKLRINDVVYKNVYKKRYNYTLDQVSSLKDWTDNFYCFVSDFAFRACTSVFVGVSLRQPKFYFPLIEMQILFRASLAHSVTGSTINYLPCFPCFFSPKVPESGNYTFFVACDDTCELWLHAEREEHVDKIKDGEASGKLLLIKLDSWTGHNQWDK